MQETLVDSRVGKICWRRARLPTPVFLGFPCGSAGKESTHNAGDLGFIPRLGRSSAEGKGYPLQYSGWENSTDCIVHGVTESRTRLSDFHFHFKTLSISTTLRITVLVGAGRSGEMDRRKLGSRWERKRKMWVVLDWYRQAPGVEPLHPA